MDDRPIAGAGKTREILQAFNLTVRKGYGQNFLIDHNVVVKMAGLFDHNDAVIEVGPGLGALTQALSAAAGCVKAFEIDEHLKPVLTQTLAGCDNVEIIWQDFLQADLDELAATVPAGYHLALAANLPYYITTPILFKVINGPDRISRIVVMMQQEVAARFLANAGGKDYNALTVVSRYKCETRLVMKVPRQSFMPRPDVDSAVVEFTRRPYHRLVSDEAGFTGFVRGCFAQRRKTINNNLKQAGYAPETIKAGMAAIEKSESCRAEELGVDDFISLYEVMGNV